MALHPRHTNVDTWSVQSGKAQGYHLNEWRIKGSGEMRRVVGLGANRIVTSRPEILGQVLADQEGQERDG